MKIFAIADLHLSGQPPAKPMNIFGSHWENHWNKIRKNWLELVTVNDTILIPGDISWAMKLETAMDDLQEIVTLPGKKILVRGNHDYWWQTLTKMTKLLEGKLTFIQNNFTVAGDYAICGSRGWTPPSDPLFSSKDAHIYQNEVSRVKMSLASARQAGYKRTILMLHFPPIYAENDTNEMTELMHEYEVEICIYGHLHGAQAHVSAPQGCINGVKYYLVACDALNFSLCKII